MRHRVLVCGDLHWDDQARVDLVLDAEFAVCRGGMTVMHNLRRGAEACAHAWVFAKRVAGAYVTYLPVNDSSRFLIRPDVCVVFGGDARTQRIVRRCKASGILVIRVDAAEAVQP